MIAAVELPRTIAIVGLPTAFVIFQRMEPEHILVSPNTSVAVTLEHEPA